MVISGQDWVKGKDLIIGPKVDFKEIEFRFKVSKHTLYTKTLFMLSKLMYEPHRIKWNYCIGPAKDFIKSPDNISLNQRFLLKVCEV